MTPDELIAIRKRFGLKQADMADLIGMTLRPYQALEKGETAILKRHALAVERVTITLAVERRDPMLAPGSVRKEALELARMLVS